MGSVVSDEMKIDAQEVFRQAIASRFGLRDYCWIMQRCKESPVLDEAFQRKFNGFYKVRRSKEKWLPVFYRIFEELRKGKRTLDFRKVLKKLHDAVGKVDASFVSKMFHTVDDSLPIIDSHVLKCVEVGEIEGSGDAKIESAVAVYGRLREWMKAYLKTDEGKRNVREFDKTLPEYADKVSDAKKIDCMLWMMGE